MTNQTNGPQRKLWATFYRRFDQNGNVIETSSKLTYAVNKQEVEQDLQHLAGDGHVVLLDCQLTKHQYMEVNDVQYVGDLDRIQLP